MRPALRSITSGQRGASGARRSSSRWQYSRQGKRIISQMTTRAERLRLLNELLAERILVIDGATGTSIQAMQLTAEDFGGPKLEGCNENLVRTRPDAIRRLHDSFLEVGADIIETDSFGSTSVVLAEYGLQADARLLNVL